MEWNQKAYELKWGEIIFKMESFKYYRMVMHVHMALIGMKYSFEMLLLEINQNIIINDDK